MKVAEKQQLAREAFLNGDYETALRLSEELLPFRDAESYFRCAIIFEHKRELHKAYQFYEYVRVQFRFHDAYNGCARLILTLKDSSRGSLALEYCREAIALQDDGIAYLLAGRIYEELLTPTNLVAAKKMYRKAAFRKSAWALRRYARLVYRYDNKLAGLLLHVLITPLFPMYRIFFGKRSMRYG